MHIQQNISKAIDLIADSKDQAAEELFENTIQTIKEEIIKTPNNIELYNYWGIILTCMEEYEQAMLKYEKIIHIDPKNENAWWQIVQSFMILDKPEESIRVLKEKLLPINDLPEYREHLKAAELALKMPTFGGDEPS